MKHTLCMCIISAAGFIHPAVSADIGTAEDVIALFIKDTADTSSLYTIPVGHTDSVQVELDYYVYEDGYLSVSGTVPAIPNSDFMLRAEAKDVYGWVYLRQEEKAYRYQMDRDGMVYIDTVGQEKIISIDTMPPPQPVPDTASDSAGTLK
ncbi:MAG: hypothetical protein ACQEQ4_06655 [Fibrobacterota bacterium]